MEAQPQVPVRITIADEEPTVRRGGVEYFCDKGGDHIAQYVVSGRGAGVKLGIKPLRAGREAPRCRESFVTLLYIKVSSPRSCVARRFTRRHWSHERDDEFMHIPSLRATSTKQVRPGKQLDQRRFVTSFNPVHECLDAEHITEIERELIVIFGQRDKPRELARSAPGLSGTESLCALFFAEGLKFFLFRSPAGARQHQPSRRHARQK